MRFVVQVLDSDGDAVTGIRVVINFSGLMRGWVESFTDSDGQAVFDGDDIDEGEGTIVIGGDDYGTHYITNGDGYTVRL